MNKQFVTHEKGKSLIGFPCITWEEEEEEEEEEE